MNFLNLNSRICVTISFNLLYKNLHLLLQHRNWLHRMPWFEQSVEQYAAIGWVFVKYLSVNTCACVPVRHWLTCRKWSMHPSNVTKTWCNHDGLIKQIILNKLLIHLWYFSVVVVFAVVVLEIYVPVLMIFTTELRIINNSILYCFD